MVQPMFTGEQTGPKGLSSGSAVAKLNFIPDLVPKLILFLYFVAFEWFRMKSRN